MMIKPTIADFNFESVKVADIAKTSTFIDKTLFIKEIIENNKTVLITAPLKFFKSTNLNVLNTFFEIEVDDSGVPKTKSNYTTDPVKDTDNYHMFSEHRTKIMEHTSIVDTYFGRHPVLSVGFKCERVIDKLDGALKYFRTVIHKAFKSHRYLTESKRLSEDEREYASIWSDDHNFHMFGKQRVATGLPTLTEYLYKHFHERRVVVLVDDLDSLLSSAIFEVADDNDLDDILTFNANIIRALLRSSRYVLFGVVVGVSSIPGFPAIDEPNGVQMYKFLEDHQFDEFFGITEEELSDLLVYPRLKLGSHVDDEVQMKYGGFISKKGTEIFNPYSVLKFLESGELENHWCKLNNILSLSGILSISYIKKYIDKLLQEEVVSVCILDKWTIKDILTLRNLLSNPDSQSKAEVSIFFTYLLAEGYLTFVTEEKDTKNCSSGTSHFRIPNNEIKQYLDDCIK